MLIAAGEKKAEELGIPYNIAVVDAGGDLISHVRMDGAWLGSVDIAINKAWTARGSSAAGSRSNSTMRSWVRSAPAAALSIRI